MIARRLSLPISLIALLVASHPAAAQQNAPPLLAPPAEPAPSEVGSVVVPQFFLGTLSTFVGGIVLLIGASATHSDMGYYAAVAVTPGIGSLVVCGVGKTSDYYEGSCAAPIIGGYVGALALGLGLAYAGTGAFATSGPADGNGSAIGVVIGAALGVIVGTAVGATVGWNLGKHRRGTVLAIAPKAPPPAALAGWPELGARPAATGVPRAGGAISVPLLSLRF
jgi:hypothetical protein